MESEKDTKQHVYVFGEEIGERTDEEKVQGEKDTLREKQPAKHYHRHVHEHHGGGVIWGCILLFAGLMLVLNNFGVVSWTFWHAIAPLWPLLLILIGLRIVFGHNVASRVIVTLFAFLFAAVVIAYGLIRTHSPLSDRMPMEWRNSVETVRVIQINP